ncbi:hypothetical protein NDU88_001172 [Pleurodeles waltl]|uniref:Endonuclease/exonuclease/phosphatase domain-containing protein n=1 Tax=Pleurodeles waltl TaxID=8319 RepID=A0AAV7Q650_PLEWA|nr:hypothetical protein NDU88_001172 [Pleurodeles waltl]
MVRGKALVFTDPQKPQHFIAKREAKGQRRNTQVAGGRRASAITHLECSGLNDNRKIHKVVAYLSRHTVDVAVLQETHLALGDKDLMQLRMQGFVRVAGFMSHVRKMLIWVRKKEGIGLQEVLVAMWRLKVLWGIVHCWWWAFMVPTTSFYYKLSALLQQWADLPQLWGEDLNCLSNSDPDQSSRPPRCPSRVAWALTETLSRDGLVDVWEHRYPMIPGYTHYSTVHDIHTRIDYWLCMQQLAPQIQDCEVLPHTY